MFNPNEKRSLFPDGNNTGRAGDRPLFPSSDNANGNGTTQSTYDEIFAEIAPNLLPTATNKKRGKAK